MLFHQENLNNLGFIQIHTYSILWHQCKRKKVPNIFFYQNFRSYNMSQGVQNSISVPLDRFGYNADCHADLKCRPPEDEWIRTRLPEIWSSFSLRPVTSPPGLVSSSLLFVRTTVACCLSSIESPTVSTVLFKQLLTFLKSAKLLNSERPSSYVVLCSDERF